MGKHYYTNNLEMESNPKQFEFKLRDNWLKFITDHGVFSKKEIDYGSRVLIKSIVLEEKDTNILDMGCGYGPIGISLAKEFSLKTFHLVDVNLRAVGLAKQNSILNDVSNVCAFYSDRYENISQQYDVIISNPPVRAGKQIVLNIIEDAIDYLNDDGSIWIVLQKKQGAPSIKNKMEALYGNCDVICRDKGYYVLKSNKT
ncbi:class I SAM-dependent methyltransferase [Haloplasma contractile]|uniref:Trans-aconitate 2-methyltransferase protein n=1 Tax=Haloplasma contractile SSD-17B TaxID=1033810 RepID=U2EC89_9MOLU|nr:class I SAM-dependent methyltransferase [Haloplasma contractile]ERJ12396.1 trans-aconitate 2-methyltransferase protein [Haloplasma contractile SSD-17B]